MNLLEKEQWIKEKSEEFEGTSAAEVVSWATALYPNSVFACSFGAEDVVLVDLIYQIRPHTDMFYLDTDFHFAETYATKDRLEQRYGITFRQIKPSITPDEQAELYGDELWRRDPNHCCNLRKVEPLSRVLQEYDAWITGIRREQAPTRANAKKIEYDAKFGLVKFNPLADWTADDVWAYIRSHKLDYHPLHDRNYPSIGCHYCTRPVNPGEDPRAGRWAQSEKIECGLHHTQ